jgi:hypothetical protein
MRKRSQKAGREPLLIEALSRQGAAASIFYQHLYSYRVDLSAAL